MKNTPFYLFVILAALLWTATFSPGASLHGQPGREISTKFFKLDIPKGWMMPAPLRSQPNGGVSAAFALDNGDLAITLNVVPGEINIPEYVERMSEDMKKNGLIASPLEKHGDFYRIAINGKVKGEGWFGATAGLFGAALIFGSNIKAADTFFAALKPLKPGLFPQSISR